MHRHLTSTEQLSAMSIHLGRDEAHHLQTVLRIRPKDAILLFDGQGKTREATVISTDKQGLSLMASSPIIHHPRPRCRLTLFACISKGKRMDWTIEKAVELGVSAIVPVISDRTIVRLDAEERKSGNDRWRRVAEEAARQCGTAWLPSVTSVMTFRDALIAVKSAMPVFVAALSPIAKPLRDALQDHPAPAQAGWFVGPEGDFTADELAALLQADAIPVSLGGHILRSETACLYGLCALNCAWL